jgi:Holliday junction resolvase RusA-like endonuclease
VLDQFNDAPEEALFLEPRDQFDPAIVGYGRRFNDQFVVYSEPAVIAALVAEQEEDDEDRETTAREHYEYNIVGGWVGEGTPAFLTPIVTPDLPELFRVRVAGQPVPQGSKRAWLNKATGRVMMAEDQGVRHFSWRREVTAAIEEGMASAGMTEPLLEPLAVRLVFFQQRPASHYGTGKNHDKVKPSALPYPMARPDLDKLTRSVLDAGTDAKLWVDDSQVCSMSVHKRFIDRFGDQPDGVLIVVSRM